MGDPPDNDAEVAVAMNSVTFDRSITPTRGRGSPRHNAARDRCLSRTSEDLRELEEISQTLHDIVDEGDATAKSWSARKRGVAEAEERVFAALRQTRQAHDERRRAVSEAEESARRVAETTTEQLAAARDAMDAIHEMEIVDERALGETRAALATSEAARDAALRRVADLEAALATADDAARRVPSLEKALAAADALAEHVSATESRCADDAIGAATAAAGAVGQRVADLEAALEAADAVVRDGGLRAASRAGGCWSGRGGDRRSGGSAGRR